MAFLCGRGFPPTAWLELGSLGAPLQQFPSRPLPLPLEGPAQDSRESGRAWGEPAAAFRVGRGRGRLQAEGVAEGTRGRRGTTREPCRRRPGIPRQALRKTRKAVLQPPSPPPDFPRRPVIALEWFPLEHTSPVVNSPRSLPVPLASPLPPPPLFSGLFDSPRARIVYSQRGWFWGFGGKKPGCVG